VAHGEIESDTPALESHIQTPWAMQEHGRGRIQEGEERIVKFQWEFFSLNTSRLLYVTRSE